MGVAYKRGQTLTENDLKIIIRDSMGTPTDPYYISYSLFDNTTGMQVLIGDADRLPATTGVGQYYVSSTIPLDANIGDWLVRWNFRETPTAPLIEVVQEFNIVAEDMVVSITGNDFEDGLIRRLRIMLRDNNPDRNYRFRPPSTENFLQNQTQVFGYIWEDEELYEYILMGIDSFNLAPPVTGVTLMSMPTRWSTLILMRAAGYACAALALNWIADEFDYSVSGVSLSIDKSSKYESMKNNFWGEFDKGLELAKRSIKIVKGLQQPRYGIGISSALGPYSRPGIQSRRNYVSGFKGA
jgi:hypothetical protein